MSWLESKLQVAYKIEGAGPREEIWEIPLTVFKEAIINAILCKPLHNIHSVKFSFM